MSDLKAQTLAQALNGSVCERHTGIFPWNEIQVTYRYVTQVIPVRSGTDLNRFFFKLLSEQNERKTKTFQTGNNWMLHLKTYVALDRRQCLTSCVSRFDCLLAIMNELLFEDRKEGEIYILCTDPSCFSKGLIPIIKG